MAFSQQSTNAFVGLDAAKLLELQAAYTQVLLDIAQGGKSYTVPGRTFTRADIGDVKETLAEINAAIAVGTNSTPQIAYPRFW
jgi:hypothetical protein